MKKLIWAENKKLKDRHLLLTVLVMTMIEGCWVLDGKMSEDAVLKGWMNLLYQMPLINALFLPVMILLITSQICDLEHKNDMLKELCCIVERKKLFDAKLLYGSFLIMLSIIIQFIAIIAFGMQKPFGGSFPAKEYLLLFLFTTVPTLILYILMHTISLCCNKPVVPFAIGIIGEFIGVFSMFLPQIPALRRIIPWGYYSTLMFVGMDYDKMTRIAAYYYLEIDWMWFGMLLMIGIVIYFAGKSVFDRCEI